MVDLPNHAVDARTVPMLALATGYSEVHGRPSAASAGQFAAAPGPFHSRPYSRRCPSDRQATSSSQPNGPSGCPFELENELA
jgi:hypothetical protein